MDKKYDNDNIKYDGGEEPKARSLKMMHYLYKVSQLAHGQYGTVSK